MIALGILVVYALYELFVSGDLVQVSRALFRLTAVVCLILLLNAHRVEAYAGAALLFGMISLVSIWSFRSEVQVDDSAS